MPKLILLTLIIVILSFELDFQLRENQLVKRVLAFQTERSIQDTAIQKQLDYWQQVVIDHPGYRDGYLQLALINTEIGKTETAQSWLKHVYQLDPNYELSPILLSQFQELQPESQPLESHLPQ